MLTIAQGPQLLGGQLRHLRVCRQCLCIRYRRFRVTQLPERGHYSIQLGPFTANLLEAQMIRRDRGIGHQLLELVVATLDIDQGI
jgi:hypothetical protein